MMLNRLLPVLAVVMLMVVVGRSDDKAKPTEDAQKKPDVKDVKKSDADPDRAALQKQFSEKMTGAALVGRFSIDGEKSDKPPQAERYELERVSPLYGDHWLFVARIKYGDTDIKVPMTLQVLWAGDTPMISLTDLAIPGLGTFTARVMFHGDRYAGTWQHGEVGGHMWGLVEPAEKADGSTKKSVEPATEKDSKRESR